MNKFKLITRKNEWTATKMGDDSWSVEMTCSVKQGCVSFKTPKNTKAARVVEIIEGIEKLI